MDRSVFRRSPALAGLFCLTLALASRDAAAQEPTQADAAAQAKIHFDRAVDLFREHDYRAALLDFRKAYELSHNGRALYNIAQTEFEVHDYGAALKSFRKYLSEDSAEIDSERRAEVEADIKQLATRVATLTLVSNAPGADVLVDDLLVGKIPLSEPLLVNAGRRKITVQKGDSAPLSRLVDLAGGDTSTLTINVSEIPVSAPGATGATATAAVTAAPSTSAPEGPSRAGLWLSLTATGLLAAGAAVTGVLAINQFGDTRTLLTTRGVLAKDVQTAHSRTQTLSIVADVLGGSAIAMGVLTIIVGVTGGKAASSEPKPSVSLGVGPRGVLVTGQF